MTQNRKKGAEEKLKEFSYFTINRNQTHQAKKS